MNNNTATTTESFQLAQAFLAHQDQHPQFPLSAQLFQFCNRNGLDQEETLRALRFATDPCNAALARAFAENA